MSGRYELANVIRNKKESEKKNWKEADKTVTLAYDMTVYLENPRT